jgi:hypothetical protein
VDSPKCPQETGRNHCSLLPIPDIFTSSSALRHPPSQLPPQGHQHCGLQKCLP